MPGLVTNILSSMVDQRFKEQEMQAKANLQLANTIRTLALVTGNTAMLEQYKQPLTAVLGPSGYEQTMQAASVFPALMGIANRADQGIANMETGVQPQAPAPSPAQMSLISGTEPRPAPTPTPMPAPVAAPFAPQLPPRTIRRTNVNIGSEGGVSLSLPEVENPEYEAAALRDFAILNTQSSDILGNFVKIADLYKHIPQGMVQYAVPDKETKDSIHTLMALARMGDINFQREVAAQLLKLPSGQTPTQEQLNTIDPNEYMNALALRANSEVAAYNRHVPEPWNKVFSGFLGIDIDNEGRKAEKSAFMRTLGEEKALQLIHSGLGPLARQRAQLELQHEINRPRLPDEAVKGFAETRIYQDTMDQLQQFMLLGGSDPNWFGPSEWLNKIVDTLTPWGNANRAIMRSLVARLPGLMYAMRGKQLSDKELAVGLQMIPEMDEEWKSFAGKFITFRNYMHSIISEKQKAYGEAGYDLSKMPTLGPVPDDIATQLRRFSINPQTGKTIGKYTLGKIYTGKDGRKAQFGGYDKEGKPIWLQAD